MQFFAGLEKNETGTWWAVCSPDNKTFYGAGGLNNVSKAHMEPVSHPNRVAHRYATKEIDYLIIDGPDYSESLSEDPPGNSNTVSHPKRVAHRYSSKWQLIFNRPDHGESISGDPHGNPG